MSDIDTVPALSDDEEEKGFDSVTVSDIDTVLASSPRFDNGEKKSKQMFFRSPDGLFHCPHKNCTFSTPYSGMARHYKSIHDYGGIPQAKKRFFKKPDGLYHCTECTYTCRDANVSHHYKHIHENKGQKKDKQRFFRSPDGLYYCPECSYSTKRRDMAVHYRRKH